MGETHLVLVGVVVRDLILRLLTFVSRILCFFLVTVRVFKLGWIGGKCSTFYKSDRLSQVSERKARKVAEEDRGVSVS